MNHAMTSAPRRQRIAVSLSSQQFLTPVNLRREALLSVRPSIRSSAF